MKSERVYLVMPAWLKESAQDIAKSKGITLSEYIKDALKSAVATDSNIAPSGEREPESNHD
jgi:hypothetical protein